MGKDLSGTRGLAIIIPLLLVLASFALFMVAASGGAYPSILLDGDEEYENDDERGEAVSTGSLGQAAWEEEEGSEEYEGEEGESEFAESLGSAAWNLGVPLVFGYVAYKHLYLGLARRGTRLPLSPALALKIHVATSLLLGAAALLHGLLLLDYAGPVEYAAAGLVALVLISGVALYYFRGRAARYARMLHAQRLLALATLAVVALHVALMD